MKCSDARELLSAYHDCELAPSQRARVTSHIAVCASCSGELASYQWLSGLTERLPEPKVASEYSSALPAEPRALPDIRSQSQGFTAWQGWVATAAAVLLIAGVWWGVGPRDRGLTQGRPSDLAAFLAAMGSDPKSAQQGLLGRFRAQSVSLEVAGQRLGYRPAATESLPSDWDLTETYLLDMPCCRCVQVIYTNSKGRSVSVFEHEAERAIVFEGEPERKCLCHGMPTTVAGSEGALAATWKNGSRFITVVGAKDLEEVEGFVESLVPRDTIGDRANEHDRSI